MKRRRSSAAATEQHAGGRRFCHDTQTLPDIHRCHSHSFFGDRNCDSSCRSKRPCRTILPRTDFNLRRSIPRMSSRLCLYLCVQLSGLRRLRGVRLRRPRIRGMPNCLRLSEHIGLLRRTLHRRIRPGVLLRRRRMPHRTAVPKPRWHDAHVRRYYLPRSSPSGD